MTVNSISNVIVAHVRSSGLALRYGSERFWLDSVGELTASQVRDRDSRGHLVWASDAMHEWFVRNFGSSQVIAPTLQPNGRTASIGPLLNSLRSVQVTRRQVLITAAVLLLVTLLLPPWIYYRAATAGYAGVATTGRWGGEVGGRSPDPGLRVPAGWHLVLLGPEDNGDSIAIDWERLGLEVLVLGVATALALYVLPHTRGTEPA